MDKYSKRIYTKDELLSIIRDFGREYKIPTIYLALMHVEKPIQTATSTL